MTQIVTLTPELISQIAAGEVVERPASVLKELLENSLDAGASRIIVKIEEAGLKLIKVVDNGRGIAADQLNLAVRPHATSKIKTAADLNELSTYGFRGEALASMSVVSDFSLTSRVDGHSGYCLRLDQDLQPQVQEVSSAVGTEVVVANLFKPIPVRQKFLKSRATELKHLQTVFINFALIQSQIHLELWHDNRLLWQLYQTKELQDRVLQVLGSEKQSLIIPVEIKHQFLNITGYLGKPQLATRGVKQQFLFVNQRPVSDFMIVRAVKDAYGTLIRPELQPWFVLNLQLAGDLVDVNVHPRKTEVRWQDSGAVFRAIKTAVSSVLSQTSLAKEFLIDKSVGVDVLVKSESEVSLDSGSKTTSKPGVAVSLGGGSPTKLESRIKPNMMAQGVDLYRSLSQSSLDKIVDSDSSLESSAKVSSLNQATSSDTLVEQSELNLGLSKYGEFNGYRLLGQIEDQYLAVSTPQGLVLVDPHAADEKYLYEKYLKELKVQAIAQQRLLTPLLVEISPGLESLLEKVSFWSEFGFEVEFFGKNTLSVQAVPLGLEKVELKTLIQDLVADLVVESKQNSLDLYHQKVAATVACRAAVMFGDLLEIASQEKILKNLFSMKEPYACPHGRPTVVWFKKTKLDQLFKRLG